MAELCAFISSTEHVCAEQRSAGVVNEHWLLCLDLLWGKITRILRRQNEILNVNRLQTIPSRADRRRNGTSDCAEPESERKPRAIGLVRKQVTLSGREVDSTHVSMTICFAQS
jgi:hypothetical protein